MSTNLTDTSYYTVPVEIVDLIKKVIFLGICPILIICGLTLNTFCCVLFCKMKKLTSTTIMLFALAITDNLILIVGALNCMSVASVYYEVPFTRQQRMLLLPYFASYLSPIPARIGNTLTLIISVERLFSVLKPMKVRQYFTKRFAFVTVLLSYFIAFGMSLPIYFYYETGKSYSNSTGSEIIIIKPTTLGKNANFTESYYVIMQTLFKFIPVLGVMVTSIATGSIVIISARRRARMAEGINSPSSQEMQVTKTLLVITFTFFICQLPTSILMVIIVIGMKPYKYSNNVYEIAMPVTYIPLLINASVNFIIYYTTSQTYKEQIKAMFPHKTVQETGLRRQIPLAANVYTIK